MNQNDCIFKKLAETVKERLGSSHGCHDFEHTMRVLANAMDLSQSNPQADREIIRFAALLHDIARPLEDESAGGCCHAKEGAVMAEKILAEYGMEKDFCSAVAEAVRTHRFRRGSGDAPSSIEAKIIYDADKLDSLGATGIGRAFLFAGKCGARIHNSKKEALAGTPYSTDDTAYREYLVKLQHLPGKMFTESGRKAAEKRSSFMKDFFKRLDDEIFGSQSNGSR
jgi:uncharacterized protein